MKMVSRAIVTYDQGYSRAACPLCDKPVRWAAQAGTRDYVAAHVDCGLTFGLLVRNYEVYVMDEHGNELDADLRQVVNTEVQPPNQEVPGTSLAPGGIVMVKS